MALNTVTNFINNKSATPVYVYKANGSSGATGFWRDLFMNSGVPAAGADSATVSGGGATYSNSSTGALPFSNASIGNEKKFFTFKYTQKGSVESYGTLLLADRLWYTTVTSSGVALSMGVTTSQTIDSIAWPARDNNSSSDGEGVYILLVSTGSFSTGSSNARISYTNSSGVGGRIGTTIDILSGNPILGHCTFFTLQEGDLGVRSVQSVEFFDSTMTSGQPKLLAIRPLLMGQIHGQKFICQFDPITTPMLPLLDNTCLSLFNISVGGNVGYTTTIVYSEG